MATLTTANDVFEMAKGMERVGQDFYTALAQGSDDLKVRQFCVLAARDEQSHLDKFTWMQEEWAGAAARTRLSPEASEGLTDLAKRQIQPDPQAVQKVAMGGNLSDALDMAAAMEQDAINFYQGLANQLPTCAEAIEAIVEQERRHLTTIRMMRTAGS